MEKAPIAVNVTKSISVITIYVIVKYTNEKLTNTNWQYVSVSFITCLVDHVLIVGKTEYLPYILITYVE